MELTQAYLKTKLKYYPDTGKFIWISHNRYHPDLFGTEAGNVHAVKKYRYIRIDGRKYFAHRLVYLYMTGSFPPYQLDHINGNKSDNRWENIRAVENRANCINKPVYRTNTSGVMGVTWSSKYKTWAVSISLNKRIHLGHFKDYFEAVCVRKSAEIKHGYHANHGRRHPG